MVVASTLALGEESYTTDAIGEEDVYSTLKIGEEATTDYYGEEDATTMAVGEETATTDAIGEEDVVLSSSSASNPFGAF